MIIHKAIRNSVISSLEEKISGIIIFNGRPAVLEVADLPAIAVYLTDIVKTENYIDGNQWGAILHIEVFLNAQDPDDKYDEWMEEKIYPVMNDIPELVSLVESLNPIGYEYRRDEELATWGSADTMYQITYLR